MLQLTNEMKIILKETIMNLKGSARRIFMAQMVNQLGFGRAVLASKELGWNRGTIRKGQFELKNGPIKDKFSDRGRKKAEDLLPNLLDDIKKIVDPESQTDPSFNSCRLYTRLTAGEVRKQLLKLGYSESELPTERTILTKLNQQGYNLKKVQKTKPKKNPETDSIFKHVHEINAKTDKNPEEIRISIDAKAKMNIGDFSRGGRNRILTKAEDHDLGVETKLTPFGFFLPQYNDYFIPTP